MSDEEKRAILAALANAFDYAATHCGTKEHAAISIAGSLQTAGFKVVPERKDKP